MFARYFIELPLRPEDVAMALEAGPEVWLPHLATEANRYGDDLLAQVGAGDRVRLSRTVLIELGTPVVAATKTVIPLRWRPTGMGGMFPALDADLEFASLGPGRTQLAISARYIPPLGAVGRALDRAFLSRVAEATLKDFLDRVGERILRSIDDGPAGDAPQATTSRRLPSR